MFLSATHAETAIPVLKPWTGRPLPSSSHLHQTPQVLSLPSNKNDCSLPDLLALPHGTAPTPSQPCVNPHPPLIRRLATYTYTTTTRKLRMRRGYTYWITVGSMWTLRKKSITLSVRNLFLLTILNLIFQSNSPTFAHSSLFSHDHSSSKQDKTNQLTTQVHGNLKSSCCTGLYFHPISLRYSSSSPKSSNSSSSVISATWEATVSASPSSPLSDNRRVHSLNCVW